MCTPNQVIEAFQILGKYGNGDNYNMGAEHDVLYAFRDVNPEEVSPEDTAKLELLGWTFSDKYESWYSFV